MMVETVIEILQVDRIAAKYGAKFHWELMPEIMANVNLHPHER
jgi:hypothetical protein